MNDQTYQIQHLRNMIAAGKVDDAFDPFLTLVEKDPDIRNVAIALTSAYHELRRSERLSLISSSDANLQKAQLTYNLLNLISEFEKKIASPSQPGAAADERVPKKTVFISYNHSNTDTAVGLKAKLEENGIIVVIDNEKLLGGQDIADFIAKSVADTDITISIVSKKSLLSAWVAMETIFTGYLQKMNKSKKFIACFIENDFFQREFTDDALDSIDNELQKIEEIKRRRLEKGRNTRDLDNEYTRLKELQNGMDEIVRRLRENICIDISTGESLQANLPILLKSIRS